jgi:hypothetical protein
MAPDDTGIPQEPPADPEVWTDEQWITWLKATDALVEGAADDAGKPATAMGRIAHSGGGQILGQAMLGMAQAIYGAQDDEIVHVADGSSEPEPDEPFTVHLDPDHPERSTVVFHSDPGVGPEG